MDLMFWLILAVLTLNVCIASALFLVVFSLDPRKNINRTFALLSFVELIWAASSIIVRLQVYHGDSAYGLYQVQLMAMGMVGPALVMFAARYLEFGKKATKVLDIISLAFATLVLFASTVLMFGSDPIVSNPHLAHVAGLAFDWKGSWRLFSLLLISPTLIPIFLVFFRKKGRELKDPIVIAVLLVGTGYLLSFARIKVPVIVFTYFLSLTIMGYMVLGKNLLNPLREMNKQLRGEMIRRHGSEKKFTKVFDLTPSMLILVDLDTLERVDVNEAYEEVTGYSREEIVGKHFIETSKLSDKTNLMKAVEHLRKGRGLDSEIVKLLTKTGEERSLLFSAEAMRMGGQRIAIISAQDITEKQETEEQLRHSLEEKDVLIQEVHHRVKNNMQIISSIMALQASRSDIDETKDVLLELQNRVRSMALAHERIFSSKNITRLSLDSFTTQLGRELLMTYEGLSKDVSIDVKVGDVHLTTDTAVNCGLVLNELLTNAFKHAFPDGKGKIVITARKLGAGKIEIIVRDNGPGMPRNWSIETTTSLGLKLVTSMATGLPDGKVEYEYDNGAVFTVTFKNR